MRHGSHAHLSGSNYILKMSDERKGPWCKVWDGLFWTFIGDHAAFFSKNPRLSMMVRTWEKMPDAKKGAHRKEADGFLGSCGRFSSGSSRDPVHFHLDG